jgi:hypothetical protein
MDVLVRIIGRVFLALGFASLAREEEGGVVEVVVVAVA